MTCVPEIGLTDHAIEQAAERCGLGRDDLERAILTALDSGRRFTPRRGDEVWVPVEGIGGAGTAVLRRDGRKLVCVTVRDASAFTQGERADERLVHSPFAAALAAARRTPK